MFAQVVISVAAGTCREFLAMPSEVDNAKRSLVTLLRQLGTRYNVVIAITRESTNKQVTQAFRKVCLKVHPDKGGNQADFQRLSAANDAWQDLLKGTPSRGRPPKISMSLGSLVHRLSCRRWLPQTLILIALLRALLCLSNAVSQV